MTRDIRPDQLTAVLAACAAPLVALGWKVPHEEDLSPQATAARIDKLRLLASLGSREALPRNFYCGPAGSRALGRGYEPRNPSAEEVLEGGPLPRVRTLRAATREEERAVEELGAALIDGLNNEGGAA